MALDGVNLDQGTRDKGHTALDAATSDAVGVKLDPSRDKEQGQGTGTRNLTSDGLGRPWTLGRRTALQGRPWI